MHNILYSNNSSYYSMIARLALAEKAVAYELHHIDIHIKMEQFAPEFVSIQPNMTVPVLVCDGVNIADSHQILLFVNKYFSGSDLCPAEDEAAILKSLDLHYAFSIEDLTMGTALRKSPIAGFALARGLKRAARRCQELMHTHPEFKSACENKLQLEDERQRLILSKENNYAQVLAQAIKLCDSLEVELSQHEFAASKHYSLADVVWTVFLARLVMVGFENFITERKHLNAYWQKMTQRKSYPEANLCTKMPLKFLLKVMFALLFKK